MKIAVWHNLQSGGAKRALFNHVKNLKEQGHYVEAWTTDYADKDYFPLSAIIIENSKPIANKVINLNKIKSPFKKLIKVSKLMKVHCEECVSEIESAKFDLIFANSCSISYMPFIGLFAKIPVVVYLGEPNRELYEADLSGNKWELPFFSFSLKGFKKVYKDFLRTYARRFQIREEIAAAKSYNRILVNSFFSRESVKRSYGIDSEICYLGIDENVFSTNSKTRKGTFVVGVGRISPAKDIELAIKAISMIDLKSRPILKWVSNGFVPDYLDKVTELAKLLEVKFIPLIDLSDNDLNNILQEAAVMIYTPWLEPFGLAPLEANLSGTFVIAISEGGIRESIQHGRNGFLVNSNSPSDIADLIIPFCSDTLYSYEMGLQARDHALKHWSNKKMANNLETILLSVLK